MSFSFCLRRAFRVSLEASQAAFLRIFLRADLERLVGCASSACGGKVSEREGWSISVMGVSDDWVVGSNAFCKEASEVIDGSSFRILEGRSSMSSILDRLFETRLVL